jgi:hypothetical protein
MDDVGGLHTAARRYCLAGIARWQTRYSDLAKAGRDRRAGSTGGWDYTDEALGTFPRYNVLAAILADIERFVPSDFASLAEARAMLEAAADAEDAMTRPPHRPVAHDAIAEERVLFRTYIASLKASELEQIQPLPFRRVLSDTEFRRHRERLSQRWGISESYWYPLTEGAPPADVVALKADLFDREVSLPALRALLRSRGIERFIELREYGSGYEADVELLEPVYNGAEGYWTDNSGEWVIYASHENSVTLGGQWLIAGVAAAWPGWASARLEGGEGQAIDRQKLPV